MNGTTLYKCKLIWPNTDKKLQKFYKETFLLFFLKDEEFVSRTINDSNLDLDKFPASKVRQLAKKLESSKSTAKYIKQASNEPQATQVHLLKHQCTELPPNKHKKTKKIKAKTIQIQISARRERNRQTTTRT